MIFNLILGGAKILDHITAASSTTTYNYGDTINTSAITVTAHYKNGTSETVSGWTVSPLTAVSSPLIVSYTDKGITKTAEIPITVQRVLSSISVSSSVTTYNYNAAIDTSAITCTATFTDGSTDQVTGFTVSPVNATSSPITVSYTENGVTKTATFAITINKVLSKITASAKASAYAYNATVGANCTATYTDGTTATVTPTLSPTKATSKTITASYTENGTTKTTTFNINVYPTASQFVDGTATVTNEGNGAWTMICKTGGTLDLKLPYSVEVHAVGGGGGGSIDGQGTYRGGSGGGGGYVKTANKSIAANTTYEVVVGSGGAAATWNTSTESVARAGRGGTSSALGVSAAGGYGAAWATTYSSQVLGGNGGSGGGAGSVNPGTVPANGGSNGGNGGNSTYDGNTWKGGTGAGTDPGTRDFGESSGTLRAGGGGGGGYTKRGTGGSGGGGNGGNYNGGSPVTATAGTTNYGGGGGGGHAASRNTGKAGGSGVVIIRTRR